MSLSLFRLLYHFLRKSRQASISVIMQRTIFSPYSLVIALLFVSKTVWAQTNQFINPPVPGPDNVYSANNVYAVGSTINLQWTTNYTTMSLVMWQNDNATFQYLSKMVPAVSTLAWTVDLQGQFSLDDGDGTFKMAQIILASLS